MIAQAWDVLLTTLAGLSALIWLIILFLPWKPWRNREVLEADASSRAKDLSNLTVLIPARNEEDVIAQMIRSVLRQGSGLRILLVDDDSSDQTAQEARKAGAESIKILSGAPLPPGWSGKLWALEQGWPEIGTEYLMLLDADIEMEEGMVPALFKKLAEQERPFVSLMAMPSMEGWWEKLFMPAFVYFFKLLYPFHLANARSSQIAAAAGGCILMKTEVLKTIGGFEPIKDALIDDCALAGRVKEAGFATWIGLSRSVRSIRPYENFGKIWNMVARTAFTQLRYSAPLLLACTVLMGLVYGVPTWIFILRPGLAVFFAQIAFVVMVVTYLPILLFYNRSPAWALCLPLTAALFLGMTWSSAFRYWKGERSRWKNRTYYN